MSTPNKISDLTIEFGGWMPAFEKFGDCGNHPQFAHIQESPVGIRFRNTGLPWPFRLYTRPPYGSPDYFFSRGRLGRYAFLLFETALAFGVCFFSGRWSRIFALLGSGWRFAREFRRRGTAWRPLLGFLLTRDIRSQLLAPDDATVFLTSIPFTLGQFNWIIEIEDTTTLFFPHHTNGQLRTADLLASPYLDMVRYLLESDACQAIITHMRGTYDSFARLFPGDTIQNKIHLVPLGIPKREPAAPPDHPDETVSFLFWNSWNQKDGGFFLRGGLDIIAAWDRLRASGVNSRLIIRSGIPADLDPDIRRILDDPGVEIIDSFLEKDEWLALQRRADVYLLPSARIHVVSLLESLASGRPVITSDGWGIDEYVDGGRTALVVPGRRGKVSWVDADSGVLNEDYGPMYAVDPEYAERLAAAMRSLVEDPALRRTLAREASRDVVERFNLDTMNRKFGAVLQGLGRGVA